MAVPSERKRLTVASLPRPDIGSLRRRYYHHLTRRFGGVHAETTFWNEWLRTRGLTWPEDYRQRLNPNQPLIAHLRPFVEAIPADTITILDVGAGPLTMLGFTHPTKRIQITATDLLADQYDRLLERYQITPPVRTTLADAEHLDRQFPRDAYDIVHAQNCLDHTVDPLRAIVAMITVAKPGRWVVLSHQENEAEKQHYRHLHQWNFTTEAGDFIVWGRKQRYNISALLANQAQIACQLEQGWLTVHITKHGL
jgi:SAM-dependent methyltransferase